MTDISLISTIEKLEAHVVRLRKDVVETERMIDWGRKRWGDSAMDNISDVVEQLSEMRVELFDAEVEISRLRQIERRS